MQFSGSPFGNCFSRLTLSAFFLFLKDEGAAIRIGAVVIAFTKQVFASAKGFLVSIFLDEPTIHASAVVNKKLKRNEVVKSLRKTNYFIETGKLSCFNVRNEV